MKCVSCGAELAEGSLLCPQCGRVVEVADVARQKAAAGQLTKQDFFKLPGMKACRSNIISCAVVLYICGALTILAAVLLQDMFVTSVLDGILLLALGLWLHLGKSRICALVTLAYGILNMVMAVINSGQLQGWWIALAGAWAVAYTFQFHKMWNKYRKEGVVPKDAVEK